MKVFKVILLLVLLFSLSFGVLGNSTGLSTTNNDITWVSFEDKWQPKTLESWFEHLTLDEKVEVYNWWKYESVNLKIVTEYGELFIRLDKEE